jgi:hypothetical protein
MADALRTATGATSPLLAMKVHSARWNGGRRLAIFALPALALLAAVLAAAWPDSSPNPRSSAGPTGGSTQPATTGIPLPAVTGMPFPNARDRLAQDALQVVKRYGPYSQTPRNVVLSSEPTAGLSVRAGDRVILLVSSGPAPVSDHKKKHSKKGDGKGNGENGD